ncbi:hypothetical protein DW254_18775 [Bacteroides caccae]|nr:hypothetical protein DW254_18775 [Bacteroides caccae]
MFCNDKGTTCLAPYAMQFDVSQDDFKPKLPQKIAKHKNAQHHSVRKFSVKVTCVSSIRMTYI